MNASKTSASAARINAPITASALGRVSSSRARMHSIAQLHTQAMDDIRGSAAVWRATRPHTRKQRCDVAIGIARRYGDDAAKKVGAKNGDAKSAAKSAAKEHGCEVDADFSFTTLVAPRGTNLLSIFASLAMTTELTGEFASYTGGLNDAYAGASSPEDVASASWAVVNQAAANGLGQADLDVLAVIADIGASSAAEWYAFEQAGGFSGPHDDDEMSIFRRKGISWKAVGWADLGGAINGALAGMAGGVHAAFLGAIVRGCIASIIAALAQL